MTAYSKLRTSIQHSRRRMSHQQRALPDTHSPLEWQPLELHLPVRERQALDVYRNRSNALDARDRAVRAKDHLGETLGRQHTNGAVCGHTFPTKLRNSRSRPGRISKGTSTISA